MIFDPERLRAYLQMVCSGLGFDIGEVWMTSTNGPSDHRAAAVTADGPSTALITSNNTALKHAKHIRFIQLYTSRSYDDKRSNLVCPSKSVEDRFFKQRNGFLEVIDDDDPVEEAQDVQRHLISPRLVDVVTSSSQVVWANCQKREGLLGRSDMRLQTAVGMPITEDGLGHMCVLIMFSPDYIHSTDDAMEYLQFIRTTAMSSSIPSLMPAISASDGHEPSGSSNHSSNVLSLAIGQSQPASFGDGVVARFVSFKNNADDTELEAQVNTQPEIHIVHDVRDAPKDCFGIPMLPDYAEFGFDNDTKPRTQSPFSEASASEAFDEASYGIWSTVMHLGLTLPLNTQIQKSDVIATRVTPPTPPSSLDSTNGSSIVEEDEPTVISGWNTNLDLIPNNKRERLEDFAVGFLGASTFDLADVWVPVTCGQLQVLRCVATASSSAIGGDKVETFKMTSLKTSLNIWSGAVGRAYGSGNPVWSSNCSVICDANRAEIFDALKIKTALAIPASSHSSLSPAFIICFYSMVRADSSPVILKFLQQAIRLVWEGLEKLVPSSDCSDALLWNDIQPSDLGEMAADREMQDTFFSKKKRVLSYTDLSSQFVHESDNNSLSSRRMRMIEGLPDNDSARFLTEKRLSDSPSFSHAPRSNLNPVGYASIFEEQAMSFPTEVSGYVFKEVALEGESPVVGMENASQVQYFCPQPIINNNPIVGTPHEYPSPNQQLYRDYAQINQIQDVFSDRFEQLTCDQQVNPSIERDLRVCNQPPAYQRVSEHPSVQNIAPLNDPLQLLNHKDYSSISCTTDTSSLNSSMYSIALLNGDIADIAVLRNNQVIPGALLVDDGVMRSENHGTFEQFGRIDSHTTVAAVSTLCQPSAGYAPVTEAFENSERICRIEGCSNFAIVRRPYCFQHNGSRLCERTGCTKCAQGSTKFCIAHGGGRRCTFPGCDKGARDKFFCAAHGGGKRCTFEGCKRSAVGGSSYCTAHGGGRRCSVEGCTKSAQSSTNYCVKHGGGKKCEHLGCKKVARGRTLYCAAHGGGVRCRLESCTRVAVGKQQLCRLHGGGSSKKSSTDSGSLSPTSTYNFDQF